MNSVIVHETEPVTLVGGGDVDPGDFIDALRLAPALYAADGGAGRAIAAGQMPRGVLGDLDSIDADSRARLPPARLHRIAEQETTDFDKCLRSIAAPLILGVGFRGPRADHALAALSGLLAHPWQACILIDPEAVICLCPPALSLSLAPGTRVSLFPLVPARGRSEGLDWPIDGLDLSPGGRIGTSNRTTGGRVQILTDAPGLLLILPRPCLGALAPARASAPSWPRTAAPAR